jgi:drug/metabolite transporter (DMT)-like permease
MSLSIGSVAALATAAAWTITAMAFEYAGKRIGAVALNFLRLAAGSVFLGIWGTVTKGAWLPLDAPTSAWLWLGASGIVGLVLGDLLLFQAFIDIGSRVAMLVYATAPALAAALGFAVLGERIAPAGLLGMALTLGGIALVVTGRPGAAAEPGGSATEPSGSAAQAGIDDGGDGDGRTDARARRGRRIRGLLLAFGGSLGQAGGLILSKIGAGSGSGVGALGAGPAMDPFAGTQIRVVAGLVGFSIALAATRSWRGLASALRDRKAIASLGLGSFFGPFLGVSLSLLAVQHASAGVASAIMSITPVLIIAPAAFLWKEKVTSREIVGALIAVAGVFALFLA